MRQSKLIAPVGFALALFISACTKEKRDAVIVGNSAPSGPATLSSIQGDVFRLSCATSGCHDNRANPASSLDLSNTSSTFSNLINRRSVEVPTMNLVTPGNPDASYLVYKLLGTHTSVGGNGVRMPQYTAPLDAAEIDRVIAWITAGAPQN